jgi:hypothetical protein
MALIYLNFSKLGIQIYSYFVSEFHSIKLKQSYTRYHGTPDSTLLRKDENVVNIKTWAASIGQGWKHGVLKMKTGKSGKNVD